MTRGAPAVKSATIRLAGIGAFSPVPSTRSEIFSTST